MTGGIDWPIGTTWSDSWWKYGEIMVDKVVVCIQSIFASAFAKLFGLRWSKKALHIVFAAVRPDPRPGWYV